MEKIFLKARAKINLNLEILNKREDGYHNLRSVFQKISLYDEIYISKTDTNSIELQTNVESLNDKDNIICKAYNSIKQKYNIGGIIVILNKNIPMQAGLGGGSTDCASFIFGVNKLFNLNLSIEEMEKIGKELGADVIPCMYNGAMFVEGIGEKVTPIDSILKHYLILIKPEVSFSTKEMYKKIDDEEIKNSKDTSEAIIKGLKCGELLLVTQNLYNSFEEVLEDKTIQNIKDELVKYGALGALMTGSGSCVYGVFKDKEEAKKAFLMLKEKYRVYYCISALKK